MQESGENYLETILIIRERNGSVRSVDVAAELGYSKPSISRAMGILRRNGYITMDNAQGIKLTAEGEKKAREIYERHRVITFFLSSSLGLSDDIAARDACRIEHIISDEAYAMMKEYVLQKN